LFSVESMDWIITNERPREARALTRAHNLLGYCGRSSIKKMMNYSNVTSVTAI